MKFFADLHIHSKYSRATAPSLDLENIHITAQIKGLNLVATGDFTHPAWFDEIKTKLEADEGGLFQLKSEITSNLESKVPPICRRQVKFILATEISNIYKKNGKTRKNHNLVFLPSIAAAEKFNSRLSKIGNIESDGRPILGLDSRDLLEIVLETDKSAFMIPAHIWTPWFSILGSRSGFDSVNECFGDLTEHIFALETGLSSDPPMNWKVSFLDKYLLVSNSDAHSPAKIAREANIFNTELSYDGILNALKFSPDDSFLGTIEFYPEEGKYHIDGHRKCGFSCLPKKSIELQNICPVCGKPLTLGVLYRVEQLADRSVPTFHSKSKPFYRLIQLEDVLAEIFQVGSKTKKVSSAYNKVINIIGSELDILLNIDTSELEKAKIPLLKEAIERIRKGDVIFSPGYDGVFGKLNIFSEDERKTLLGQNVLFDFFKDEKRETRDFTYKNSFGLKNENKHTQEKLIQLNCEQRMITEFGKGPLLVIAGPGTGKTFTITKRILRLMESKIVHPEKIMVVTFTNKAADEINERLSAGISAESRHPLVGTFHSICLKFLTDYDKNSFLVIDDKQKIAILNKCKSLLDRKGCSLNISAKRISELISLAKLQVPVSFKGLTSDENYISKIYHTYQDILRTQGYHDYDDLILFCVNRMSVDESFLNFVREKAEFLFVDEYQDINYPQYLFIKKIATETGNICAIGDPNQAIYGFRGSDLSFFKRFIEDYPSAQIFNLVQNYRTTENILNAAYSLIKDYEVSIASHHISRPYTKRKNKNKITILKTSSERAEAVAVGKIIEELVGGYGFHSIDFDKFDYSVSRNLSFGDFAVLFRTSKQSDIFKEVFSSQGIPYQSVKKQDLFEDEQIEILLALLRIISCNQTITDIEKLSRFSKPPVSKKAMEKFIFWLLENKLSLEKAIDISRKVPLKLISIKKQKELVRFFVKISEIRSEYYGKPVADILINLHKNAIFQKKFNNNDLDPKFKMLIDKAERFGSDIEAFLSSLSLFKDQDVYDQKSEKVALMTMHAAKGLEFPVVFVSGCEDGLVPFKNEKREPNELDEERRLFYVSMTRAKDLLFLSYASKRKIYGKTLLSKPSPFLKDIGKNLIYKESPSIKKRKESGAKQLLLFE